ncbi:ABC transporter substrate-binding protein [Streptomyces sp. NPDC007325]|uniref:ABC transporter substrate-binding protein n=1 Tax=Streptomyces sp. NPDC007325 TaxID=3154588 RepID=UPI0033D21029
MSSSNGRRARGAALAEFRIRRARRSASAVTAVLAVTVLAGCGQDDPKAKTEGAGQARERGPITLAMGKDTTGTVQSRLDRWNKDHPAEKVTLVELPESADQQRRQFVQNAQTKSDAYSVLNLDVVWTAEFASNQWIDELPKDAFPLDKMIPAVVGTGSYFGKQYAVPFNTNAGLLFYRKDLLTAAGAQVPTTWAQMKETCAKIAKLPEGRGTDCYAGQFDTYEGLTVNFSEAVASAGGAVVDDQGRPTVDTPAAEQGLSFLAEGFRDGTFPKNSSTFQEEDGRRAFQAGKLVFHRQWPYQWTLANATDGSSKVAGKFGVAVLPGHAGAGRSSLGGLNLAVSTFAENKATAVDFIRFMTSEENARANLEKTSAAPPYAALYDDPALRERFPYLATLKQSLDGATTRPTAVRYGDVTAAVQENVRAALTGAVPVDKALADLQRELDALTEKP